MGTMVIVQMNYSDLLLKTIARIAPGTELREGLAVRAHSSYSDPTAPFLPCRRVVSASTLNSQQPACVS